MHLASANVSVSARYLPVWLDEVGAANIYLDCPLETANAEMVKAEMVKAEMVKAEMANAEMVQAETAKANP